VFFVMAGECFADAAAQLELVETYADDKNFHDAEVICQNIITNYPGSDYAFEAQKWLAILYILWEKPAQAGAAFKEFVAKFSENEHIAKAVDEIALRCLQSQKHKEANEFCQYVIDTWPQEKYAVWSQLAATMSNIALGRDADAAIEKLVTEYSEHKEDIAAFLNEIAYYYLTVPKKYEKANQLYQYISERLPLSEVEIWLQGGLAMSNIAFGRDTAAQAAIEKLLTEFSDHEDLTACLNEIAYYYLTEQKKYEKANQLYQYILGHWPESEYAMWSHGGVAVSSAALGKTEAADAAIEKLLTEFSGHPGMPQEVLDVAEIYYSEGFREENEGLVSQAKESFQKVLAIAEIVKNRVPGYVMAADTCCWTGASYRALGEYEKSIECYQKVVDDYPSYHMAWHALFMVGRNYEELGKSAVIPQLEADMKIKTAYQQLLENYPDCSAAKPARDWLNRHN
ncbi:MAG: tetratricopeptide repeat protein, partial [Candidatus Bathyarchaeota archaeon]|nr:tetratricopeptide repeat protein [Candidatus Bathyarchaeota archaeon]